MLARITIEQVATALAVAVIVAVILAR